MHHALVRCCSVCAFCFASHALHAQARPDSAARDTTPRALETIRVRADALSRSAYGAARSVSAMKTDTPLRNTPQSVSVIGRALISDQSMRSMADVVRYIPGVAMGQGEGHRDAPTIRGNASTADLFIDGVRDDAQYLRDLYNVERVEALKGPNAMIFGRGGGGGVINRVSKEARWSPTSTLTVEGGPFDQRRATIDLGDGLSSRLAARLNGMYERTGFFRDRTRLERFGVNPSLGILVGGTVARVDYEHFTDDRTVDRGLPSFQGRPSAADIHTFFGDPDGSRSHASVDAAGLLLSRELAPGITIRNRSRYAYYDKFYQNVFPGAVNAAGDEVSLAAYNNATARRNVFNQTDVTLAVRTGALDHTLLVGAEVGRQATDNFRNTGYFDGSATTHVVPFASPTVEVPVTYRQSATDADNHVVGSVAAVYAQDQIALTTWLQAVAGLRYDRFSLRYHNNRDGQRLQRDDQVVSPRAGIIVKPAEPLSIYGAYSISFLPSSGDQFSSLTATTKTLEPERFANREIGVKWDVHPDLAITAALYRLDRTNTTAPDPVEPTRVVQTGHQRTTGHEVGVTGTPLRGWQLSGGWAVQRATIVSRTAAARPGASVPLVPHHTLSLWNRYQVTRAFGAGLGVVHQADSWAAIDNSVTLPAFTRVDAALYVTLTRRVRAQLNLENVFDTRYYGTSHGNNNIMPGAPRSLRLSLTAGE